MLHQQIQTMDNRGMVIWRLGSSFRRFFFNESFNSHKNNYLHKINFREDLFLQMD